MQLVLRVTATVRRIGNSLGIVIPNELAKESKISEGDLVEVEVKRSVNYQDLFGSWKTSKSAQQLKDEAREGWGD